MAHIYQKTFTKVDPRTGKKVTRKWRVRYRDADGVMCDIPGFKDRDATKQLAAEVERRVARQKVGLVDRFAEHRKGPLGKHLDDFAAHLEAKGNTSKHVKLKIRRIKTLLDGCGFKFIPDLVPSRLERWLADQRADDDVDLSIQTSNHDLTCVKGFCRWLVTERRMADNPFVGVRGLNPKLDVRRERRVLSDEGLAKFLEAARKGKPFRGLAGPDRLMLYRLVLYTGLRCTEAASLTPESFELDAEPPTVTVKAGYSNRRKEDLLVLRGDLARGLERWLRWKPRGEPVFAGTWMNRASQMVEWDLDAAGIAYQTEAGYFDFHSLRHQFVSSLARAGVHPKVAQGLARHSDINLTMSRYAHLARVDEKRAVEALPELGREPVKARSAKA